MSSSRKSEWYHENYVVSTAKHLLQPEVVNKAFGSDDLYWVKSEPIETIKKILENSFCFGLYELPKSTSDIAGRRDPTQIGLARLVTDEVTFAYLTDVFVLRDHRGKGLGKWLLECMNEELNSWPNLRCLTLMTSSDDSKEFYRKILGTERFEETTKRDGLEVCWKLGPGSFMKH